MLSWLCHEGAVGSRAASCPLWALVPSAAHWACVQGNQALSWEGLGKFIVRLRASISPQPSPPHLTITGSTLRPWPGIKVPVTGPCSHPSLISHHPSSPHILAVCTSPGVPGCFSPSHLCSCCFLCQDPAPLLLYPLTLQESLGLWDALPLLLCLHPGRGKGLAERLPH